MALVVGLAFLFGFGNVWTLALHLGVPGYVAPLVAPAVDLSVIGLLVGIRILVIADAEEKVLRPARLLLLFSSLVTLALNVAEPIIAQQYGKAAFDAVGPMLLIGWAEVGPSLMQAMQEIEPAHHEAVNDRKRFVIVEAMGMLFAVLLLPGSAHDMAMRYSSTATSPGGGYGRWSPTAVSPPLPSATGPPAP
jgi:hypothetical protein